jgi:hypothetical protein
MRVAAVRVSGHQAPDVVVLDLRAMSSRRPSQTEPRQLTDLMAEAWG